MVHNITTLYQLIVSFETKSPYWIEKKYIKTTGVETSPLAIPTAAWGRFWGHASG